MHDSLLFNLSTKTTINVIEYSINKIIFCLSILVMLGKTKQTKVTESLKYLIRLMNYCVIFSFALRRFIVYWKQSY